MPILNISLDKKAEVCISQNAILVILEGNSAFSVLCSPNC